MWNQGIHARSGVACADCHMPYQREGALKISDHHVRSPLLNINRACQTCHRWSEDELRERVDTIQDRTYQVRNVAMDALVGADRRHQGRQGRAARPTSSWRAARDEQRQAQFLLDFIEAENSMGFHAPQEADARAGDCRSITRAKASWPCGDAERGFQRTLRCSPSLKT